MRHKHVAAALIGLFLFCSVAAAVLRGGDTPCFDSGASYRCPDCGWSVWAEGSMNRDGTYEPMVAHLRIDNHNYECQAAQRENKENSGAHIYAGGLSDEELDKKWGITVERPAIAHREGDTVEVIGDYGQSNYFAVIRDIEWDNYYKDWRLGFEAGGSATAKNVKRITSQTCLCKQCDCDNCTCCLARAVPQVSLEQGWKRGPLAPNTWYWGAVTLVGQKTNGFYFADFYGSYVLIDIDGKKRRIEPADVAYYNNSLRSPVRK